MAKVAKTQVVVKTPKVQAGLQTKRVNTNYYKPNNKILTANQQAKLGRMQQRTTRAQNRMNASTTRYVANKGAGLAKAIGSGIAEVTTPFAASMGAQRTAEQIAANRNYRENQSLNNWNSLIDGNPDKETGNEGEKQYEVIGSVLGG